MNEHRLPSRASISPARPIGADPNLGVEGQQRSVRLELGTRLSRKGHRTARMIADVHVVARVGDHSGSTGPGPRFDGQGLGSLADRFLLFPVLAFDRPKARLQAPAELTRAGCPHSGGSQTISQLPV